MTDKQRKANHQDVDDICGRLPDAKLAAILAVEASVEELEEAAAYFAGEDDVMGELRKPASGRVAAILDILTVGEEEEEEREPE